jgi:GLPGLI family protein
MKFKILIIFLFFNLMFFSQSIEKNIKITYGFLNHSSELINEKKFQKDVIETYQKTYEIAENILSFELLFNNNESIFYKNKLIFQDSYSPIQQILLNVTEDKIFYRNIEKNEFFFNFNFFSNSYLVYVNKFKDVEFTTETKKINDYLCYKAKCYDEISKQNITIWYSPDLNYNIGPLNFHNFPGLVLEVNFKYYSIVCNKIEFNPNIEIFEKLKPPKGEKVTQEELLVKLENSKSKLKKN